MHKPFTFTVRYDIAPDRVAAGFTITDEIALKMLTHALPSACPKTDFSARVLIAPTTDRIGEEQGYAHGEITSQIKNGASLAYSDNSIAAALKDAIELIDSVTYVRDKNDNSAMILENLRAALNLLGGNGQIADFDLNA